MRTLYLLLFIFTFSLLNAQLNVSIGAQTDADCNGDNASVFVTISGGSGDYDIYIDSDNYFATDGTNIYPVIGGGAYPQYVTVNVSDWITGESFTDYVEIYQSTPMIVGFIEINSCSCSQLLDLSGEVSYGTPPFTVTVIGEGIDNQPFPISLCPDLYNYDLIFTDANGCQAIHYDIGFPSAIVTVAVSSQINNYRTQSICGNDSILLEGNYQNNSGYYRDTIQTQNGCDSIVTTHLIVHPSYLINESTTICDNDSVFLAGNFQTNSGTYIDSLQTIHGCDSIISTQLIVNSVNTNIAIQNDTIFSELNDSYQWLDCNNAFVPIAGATESYYYPTTNGSYAVILTNNSCTDTSMCINYQSVNLRHQSENELLLYPNPVHDNFTIEFKYKINNIVIYDIRGKIILQLSGITQKKYEIPFSQFSSGIYFLEVNTENQTIFKRIIKQ